MIKKYGLPILALFIALYFFNKEDSQLHSNIKVEKKVTTDSKNSFQTSNKKMLTGKNRFPASVKPANQLSDLWEKDLKEHLQLQGGKFIKEIKVTKERSFTFTKDMTPLHAHTVKIDLTSKNDESSSFRAIVDASTGKILETFDRTQFDHFGHKNGPVSFKAEPFFQ